MSPEYATIAAAIVVSAGTVVAAWLANSARHAANAARLNSAPVSNGFADGVNGSLGEIKQIAVEGRDNAAAARDEASNAHQKVDEHLAAHANAHVYQFQPREARQ